MFRIDFAARVMQDDGSTRLVLIELQKTWLSTETLRFRRYLAAQYNAEENMLKESNSETGPYAIPMIAIYLLGHRIGDIDKAVVYVNHKALDYDGKEIENGENDPFINSLTHDSIIVQIPLLHGKINNKLDRVLSVFDQSQRDDSNQHIIRLDINNYEGDSELMHLVHRLGLAAMNASVRQEMDDEDEFFSAIESRDTQLMQMNKRLSETTSQLNETTSQLNETTSQLNETTSQLNETTAQLKAVVEVMLQNGMSVETIANTINKSADDVKDLLKS